MRMSSFLLKNGFRSHIAHKGYGVTHYCSWKFRVEFLHYREVDAYGNENSALGIKVFKNQNMQSWKAIGILKRHKGRTKDLWALLRALADPRHAPALAGIPGTTAIMEEMLR